MKHARPDYDRIQDPANKIPAEEPVFLLRGQDLLAPATLRHYANALRHRARNEPGLPFPISLELENMALTVDVQAELMDRWQSGHTCKFPDLPL